MIRKVIGYWLLVIGLLFAPPTTALAATLSLSPTSGTYNKNCNLNLNIALDTQGDSTEGIDVYLLYDISKFSANTISKGTIFSDYPITNIDASAGKIYISGLADVSKPFSGQGTVATVNFTVKPTASTGISQIKFDFDPNDKTKTTDSNVEVIQNNEVVDVLAAVTDGSFTVGSGTACLSQGGIGGPAATSSATASGKTLVGAGSEGLTLVLAVTGGILVIFGILGLVLL